MLTILTLDPIDGVMIPTLDPINGMMIPTLEFINGVTIPTLMGSKVGIVTPSMGLPCQVKHEPHHFAQQMMREAHVSQGRTGPPTRCHGTPRDPPVPCSRDAQAKPVQGG